MGHGDQLILGLGALVLPASVGIGLWLRDERPFRLSDLVVGVLLAVLAGLALIALIGVIAGA